MAEETDGAELVEEPEPKKAADDVLRELAMARALRDWADLKFRAASEEAGANLYEAYRRFGAKSVDVIMFGHKVARFSMSFSNPQVAVADPREWETWLKGLADECDPRVTETVVYSAPTIVQDAVVRGGRVFDSRTGEEIPGLVWREGGEVSGYRLGPATPGKGRKAKGVYDAVVEAVLESGATMDEAVALFASGEEVGGE